MKTLQGNGSEDPLFGEKQGNGSEVVWKKQGNGNGSEDPLFWREAR